VYLFNLLKRKFLIIQYKDEVIPFAQVYIGPVKSMRRFHGQSSRVFSPASYSVSFYTDLGDASGKNRAFCSGRESGRHAFTGTTSGLCKWITSTKFASSR
jgi:hypothetical protein